VRVEIDWANDWGLELLLFPSKVFRLWSKGAGEREGSTCDSLNVEFQCKPEKRLDVMARYGHGNMPPTNHRVLPPYPAFLSIRNPVSCHLLSRQVAAGCSG